MIYLRNFKAPFSSVEQAKNELEYFINTCMKANSLGFKMLHLHQNIGKDFYQLQIAPNYTMCQWLQSSGIKKELKSRFRSITTRTPLINDEEPIAKERNTLSEFKIRVDDEIKMADGLGAAYLLGTLCVSFLSHDLWGTDEINNIKHWYLTEAGNEITEIIAVKHASKPAHLAKHQAWFEQKKRESLQKSRDLWERREEFFPHLVLCGFEANVFLKKKR